MSEAIQDADTATDAVRHTEEIAEPTEDVGKLYRSGDTSNHSEEIHEPSHEIDGEGDKIQWRHHKVNRGITGKDYPQIPLKAIVTDHKRGATESAPLQATAVVIVTNPAVIRAPPNQKKGGNARRNTGKHDAHLALIQYNTRKQRNHQRKSK